VLTIYISWPEAPSIFCTSDAVSKVVKDAVYEQCFEHCYIMVSDASWMP